MTKKVALILLVVILLIAAFLRLYLISDYMTFLGDEGRDALVAKGILEGKLTLLGPRASAGDFFTGPIYYYMMAPFLGLFMLDPVGPAVMVALLSVATVWLIYYVSLKWFDRKTGLFAAALYAVSPLVINYSHSSWNPDTVPFFSLLTLYLLYQGITKTRSWKYYVGVGLLLGVCIQLHYISLFLATIVALSLFLVDWYHHHEIRFFPLIKNYFQIFVGFLVGFSPFLAFEARHEFMNFKAIAAFVTKDTTQLGYETYNTFYEPIADVFFRLFGRLVFAFPRPSDYDLFSMFNLQLAGLVVLVIAFASLVFLVRHKNKEVVILLSIWLVVGTALFGFYKKEIYDYYLVFLFPLPFLLIGNLLGKISALSQKHIRYGMVLSLVLLAIILAYNFSQNPFRSQPNKQKEEAKKIAQFILSKTDNEPYNFALLSSGNSDHAYRYFMDVSGHPPIVLETPITDPERRTVTKQLLVACDDRKCNPLGNPLWEVAGFGDARVVGKWDFSVLRIYKLVPTNQ